MIHIIYYLLKVNNRNIRISVVLVSLLLSFSMLKIFLISALHYPYNMLETIESIKVKKKKTLVFGNVDDEKYLHPGGREFFF